MHHAVSSHHSLPAIEPSTPLALIAICLPPVHRTLHRARAGRPATMSPRRCAGRVPPPSREREHHPSFSAALLDAIYHSLDADACAPAGELRRANVSPSEMPSPPPSRHRRPSTASSPSVSSARSPRPPKPPRPCRVLPHPQATSLLLPPPPPISMPAPAAVESKENRKIRRKKRSKSAAFACLLNALLCNRKPQARSSSVDATAMRALPPTVAAEPASARSILSSRASRRDSAAAAGGFLTPGRRAVRFSPAVEVVVDEEEHGHGARTTGRLRDASGSGTESSAAADAERRVEELLRALSVAEERERAKESSESSSDLFELESLPPAIADTELARTTVAAAGLAPPRRRVLLDEMVV
uniref:Uncharacterized protein n=1 Tax=Aegilops tauschii subsp. strangulata TaxID=200361 RepID=A0A453PQD5_AEGTS|nr:protein BIG GRAIN 1-like A [Aegilops tauschii subsp. strangulata]